MAQQAANDLSEIIAENFGANATYVEGMLSRWRNDPASVDESWRAYFAELLGESGASTAPQPAKGSGVTLPQADGSGAVAASSGDGHKSAVGVGAAKTQAPAMTPKPAPSQKTAEPQKITAAEAIPIRGAALKIVENMEASLSVPTATSQRRIPVKLLG